jgi:putative transposase
MMTTAAHGARYEGMGRPPRRFAPGYPAHVIHRGNNRQDIFHCESDFRYLWRSLREASAHFEVDINAYVFMTNHVHLILTPRDNGSISRMMHWVARRYAGYFNQRYERTGHCWGGRFRSFLITEERYLLECHRYIDLNPVRAELVRHPADYAWSSHRFYAFGDMNDLVTPHSALEEMGLNDATRRMSYQALFRDAFDPTLLKAIRSSVKSGRPIGEKARRRPRRKPQFVPGTNVGLFVPGTN